MFEQTRDFSIVTTIVKKTQTYWRAFEKINFEQNLMKTYFEYEVFLPCNSQSF
jgi:hypothetical protein